MIHGKEVSSQVQVSILSFAPLRELTREEPQAPLEAPFSEALFLRALPLSGASLATPPPTWFCSHALEINTRYKALKVLVPLVTQAFNCL